MHRGKPLWGAVVGDIAGSRFEGNRRSQAFANEIYHNEGEVYGVGENERAEMLEPVRPHAPCPVCKPRGRTTAVLAIREGQRGKSQDAQAAKPAPITTADTPSASARGAGRD